MDERGFIFTLISSSPLSEELGSHNSSIYVRKPNNKTWVLVL